MKKVIATVLIAFAACAAHAQTQTLERPLLLVASPALQGAYSKTALLVFPMRGQHAGFILNRSTDVKLGAVFPDHAPSGKVVDPIYFGGPEMVDSLFAMVRKDPGSGALKVQGDLFVTAEAETVDRIIEQTPNDARYFAGFVGWRPGELAKEIESGYWYVEEFDASQAFHKEPATMWEELVERLGNGHPRPLNLRGA